MLSFSNAQGGHMDQPPWKQPTAAPNVQQRWVRTKAVEKRFEPASNAQSTVSDLLSPQQHI